MAISSVRLILPAFCACLVLNGCDDTPAARADADPIAATPTAAPASSASNLPDAPRRDAIKPDARSQTTPQLDDGFAPIAFDLTLTSWLVVRIDGRPMNEVWGDPVTLRFGRSTIRWNGCNSHEGLYVQSGGTFATDPQATTHLPCPSAPDRVISGVLASQPMIAGNAEGKIMLATPAHRLTLSQIDGAPE